MKKLEIHFDKCGDCPYCINICGMFYECEKTKQRIYSRFVIEEHCPLDNYKEDKQ